MKGGEAILGWQETGLTVPRLKEIPRKRDLVSSRGPADQELKARVVERRQGVWHCPGVGGGDLNKLYRVDTKRV